MTTVTSSLGWGITRKRNKEMREILFRGKRVDNGEWVEGELLHDMKGRPWIYWTTPKELPIFFSRSAIVKSETIGQYIGLKDKNGKKIFEGDIVKFDDCVYTIYFGEAHIACCGCTYDYYGAGCFLKDGNYITASQVDYKEMEVIGNTHDNRALLEAKE